MVPGGPSKQGTRSPIELLWTAKNPILVLFIPTPFLLQSKAVVWCGPEVPVEALVVAIVEVPVEALVYF